MWTFIEIRESLSDSTKLWVNASSLFNTVKRLTTKRERDQSNGWGGFQKLYWLWIVRWPVWLERNLLTESKTSRLMWRVQLLSQDLLAWRRRYCTPLVNWKVLKAEPQIQSGLWRSMVSRTQLWMKESQFSTIWKMVQSVYSFKRGFDCSSWNLVDSWKNSLIWKKTIEISFLIDLSNPGESIQETEKDMNNKKIRNLADPTDNEDAANKKYVDEKTETIDSFTFFFTKYAPRSLFIETSIKEKATCWYHTDHNSDNEVLHYNSIVLIFLINHDWTTMQHKTENFTQTKNIHFNKQWKTLFLFFMKIGNFIFFFKKKMNTTCSIHRYWKKRETISNTKIQSLNK